MQKFEAALTFLSLIILTQAACLAQVTTIQTPVSKSHDQLSVLKDGPDETVLFDESLANDTARVNPTGVLVRDYQQLTPRASGPVVTKPWKAGLFAGEVIVAWAFIYGAFAWGTRIYRQSRSRETSIAMTPPIMARRVRSIRRRRSRTRTPRLSRAADAS